MPDIAHAPDQIRTSPRKLPACSCGNLSLQRILRTSSLNIILHFSSICNKHISRNYTRNIAVNLCTFNKIPLFCLKITPKTDLRSVFRRLIFIFCACVFCTKCRNASNCTNNQSSALFSCSSSSADFSFAARSLSRDLQKSSLSHSGSRIRISASDAISAPKKTRIF